MASRCANCKKGIAYGHLVSHAKNRTKRIIRPNLQRLKVMLRGLAVRVTLCTSCIKRLKKDGRIGVFTLHKYAPSVSPGKPVRVSPIEVFPKEEIKKETKEEKAKETLKVEAIVGKKG